MPQHSTRARSTRGGIRSLALSSKLSTLVTLALCSACAGSPARSEGPPDTGEEGRPEAISLFGQPLAPPPLSEEVRAQRQAELDEALAAVYEHPADGWIWIGRRLAYMGRFNDATLVYWAGWAAYPDDPRFGRHLGHRLISQRSFRDAELVLAQAAEDVRGSPDRIEPDGQPNSRGIPLTTLQSNIHYHLGLARYLQGDYEGALEAYADYRAVSDDDDGEVAVDHWSWMALRRLGRDEEARAAVADVHPGMDIVENHGYYRLCLMYQGELSPEELLAGAAGGEDPAVDDATVGYGVGNWFYVNDRVDEAVAVWRRVLQGQAWHAFGYIAAEADLHRLGVSPR